MTIAPRTVRGPASWRRGITPVMPTSLRMQVLASGPHLSSVQPLVGKVRRFASSKTRQRSTCESCGVSTIDGESVCLTCMKARSAAAGRKQQDNAKAGGANPWDKFVCTAGKLSFFVPEEALREEYRSRIKQLHPDKSGQSATISSANERSSLLRSAYETLLDPVARADRLCQLKYNETYLGETSNIEDDEFMADILMAVEFIHEEILPAPEPASPMSSEALDFRATWRARLVDQLETMARTFRQLESSKPTGAPLQVLLEQLRNTLHVCVAIKKLLAQLDEKLLALGYEIAD